MEVHWFSLDFNEFIRILPILSYIPMMAVYINIYTFRGISDFWTPGHGFSPILVHFSPFPPISTNFPANQIYLMRMCPECQQMLHRPKKEDSNLYMAGAVCPSEKGTRGWVPFWGGRVHFFVKGPVWDGSLFPSNGT